MSRREIFALSLNKTSGVDLKQQPHFHFPINLLPVAIALINLKRRANLWHTSFQRLRSSPLTSDNDSIFWTLCKVAGLTSRSPLFPNGFKLSFHPLSFTRLRANRSVLLPASALRFMSSITVSDDLVDFFFSFFLSDSPYLISSPLPNSVILWPGE